MGDQLYVIESIRTHDGVPTERHFRRKGQHVHIAHLKRGEALVAVYVDDGGKLLRTTRVQQIADEGDTLIVTTRNGVYTFVKEGAQ
ncbi:hypothetical protein P4H42_03705 [Paenibacillus macerans]|uniref:hypothetical protein n=1 Tax=Paenibacillus macerans TaxID=44252 RepID=UPI002DBA379A|nr:hypothetical protein [Paenibacillus macerans]MEC0328728.1 hypothetical protein [Paenibacillus macerans]